MRWPFRRRDDRADNGAAPHPADAHGDAASDPVTAVLAAAGPLVALFGMPGERIEPAEVGEWVTAEGVEDPPPSLRGYRVLVSFADECWLLADPDDDLAARLAAQPGVEAAVREDREGVWVRSRLPVERVRAAAVAALLAAHRAAAGRLAGDGRGETDGG